MQSHLLPTYPFRWDLGESTQLRPASRRGLYVDHQRAITSCKTVDREATLCLAKFLDKLFGGPNHSSLQQDGLITMGSFRRAQERWFATATHHVLRGPSGPS